MDLGLRDRVALVCGGSSGLGFAVARQLLLEGARVALNGRDHARLAEAARRLEERPEGAGRVRTFPADVTTPGAPATLVEAVHAALGGPDILLCNAGGPPPGAFDQHSSEAWQAAIELSLLSTVHLCRAAVPHMRTRHWGRILCLTSLAAKQPVPGLILSSAARAGVLGFAKALADEVAREGITVNVLCPGFFETERLRGLAASRGTAERRSTESVLDEMGRSVPTGRVGQPEEFAAVATFLASEPARFVTGTAISVDGGQARSIL